MKLNLHQPEAVTRFDYETASGLLAVYPCDLTEQHGAVLREVLRAWSGCRQMQHHRLTAARAISSTFQAPARH